MHSCFDHLKSRVATTRSRLALIGIASITLATALALTASAIPLASPPSERPTGAAPLSASMPEDAIQFFKDKNFGGSTFQISDVTSKPSWKSHDFEGRKNNKVTAIRWNLPRGVVVTLHERDDGLGRMIALYGSGEIDALSKWKMNDELSTWSWNYIGGVKDPARRIDDGKAARPRYVRECDPVAADSLHLFKDRECKGKAIVLEHVTSQPMGAFTDMPGDIKRGTSSLRWKLPDGVLVVLAAEKGGTAYQTALWGEGQIDGLVHWSMNDKVTQWAWYNVGE